MIQQLRFFQFLPIVRNCPLTDYARLTHFPTKEKKDEPS